MRGGERTVKWLDPKLSGVLFETSGTHQRNSTESAHVRVMQSSTVIQLKPQSRIVELVAPKMSVVYEQRAGKSRLHDQSISGVEIENHQLCPSPTADYRRVPEAFRERARIHLAQNVALANRYLRDFPPANRAVQIARDRLSLR